MTEIAATLQVFASRTSSPQAVHAPDCRVAVSVRGKGFANSTAKLRLDGALLLECGQPAFHNLCTRIPSEPAHNWPLVANELGLSFALTQRYLTLEQNLVKVAALVVIWIEPYIVSGDTGALEGELDDEVIVDRTDLGRPRTVYFPPLQFISRAPKASISRLHELGLLGRLEIDMAGRVIERRFVPLVVPTVLISRFDPGTNSGGVTYQTWARIRERMKKRILRAVER